MSHIKTVAFSYFVSELSHLLGCVFFFFFFFFVLILCIQILCMPQLDNRMKNMDETV